jgi:hypothetical protein
MLRLIMVERRIDAGKRYLANPDTALINVQPPRGCLKFPALHEFMDHIMRVSNGTVVIAQADAVLVLDVAASVAQFEAINRHVAQPDVAAYPYNV